MSQKNHTYFPCAFWLHNNTVVAFLRHVSSPPQYVLPEGFIQTKSNHITLLISLLFALFSHFIFFISPHQLIFYDMFPLRRSTFSQRVLYKQKAITSHY